MVQDRLMMDRQARFKYAFDKVLGRLFCVLLMPFVRRHVLVQDPRSICVLRGALGESVLTLPMIDALHRRFPKATIDVIVRGPFGDVFVGQKCVRAVRRMSEVPFLLNRYDLCIDADPCVNSSAIIAFLIARYSIGFSHGARHLLYSHTTLYRDKRHVVFVYMDLLKVYGVSTRPKRLTRLRYGKMDVATVDKFLRDNGIGPRARLVGIGAGAGAYAPCRLWPARNFAAVCDHLVGEGFMVVLFGSPGDAGINDDVIRNMVRKDGVFNLAGRIPLRSVFCLVDKLSLMISNDTGIMHVAAAQGVRTIGLFCPNSPIRYGPFGPGNSYVYKPVANAPCINVHRYQITCTNKDHRHMSRITVEDVLKKVRGILPWKEYS